MNSIKKYSFLSVGAILVFLTVIGSFFDYEIAKCVYIGQQPSENIFGIIFAFIGIIPTFVGWSFLGASILCLTKKQACEPGKRRLLTALAVLLFVLSFFYFCNTLMMVNANAFSVHWAIAYPIGILIIAVSAFLGYKLSLKTDNENLLSTVLFLSLFSIIVMIIIMSTKGIMERPRFRFVLESSTPEYFRCWWQSGRDIKSSIKSNALSDEFSSFPSGHSAYSMFAIFLFPAFADYIKPLNKYRGLLFLCGFAWWGLTAFSRLTVGAHYLTDVSIAGLVTLVSYALLALAHHIIKNILNK